MTNAITKSLSAAANAIKALTSSAETSAETVNTASTDAAQRVSSEADKTCEALSAFTANIHAISEGLTEGIASFEATQQAERIIKHARRADSKKKKTTRKRK